MKGYGNRRLNPLGPAYTAPCSAELWLAKRPLHVPPELCCPDSCRETASPPRPKAKPGNPRCLPSEEEGRSIAVHPSCFPRRHMGEPVSTSGIGHQPRIPLLWRQGGGRRRRRGHILLGTGLARPRDACHACVCWGKGTALWMGQGMVLLPAGLLWHVSESHVTWWIGTWWSFSTGAFVPWQGAYQIPSVIIPSEFRPKIYPDNQGTKHY